MQNKLILHTLLLSIATGTMLFSMKAFPQQSIHQQQSEYFGKLNLSTNRQWDSLWMFKPLLIPERKDCNLEKKVFGYHPYWMGSSYINYQWNLVSDLCYFSYEVDPSSGNPVTTHDWLTAPVIDSALANGVNIHLCITLFSGHSTFFSNELSKQTLISNIISLLQQRNAKGVNMDVEALPSSQILAYNDFLVTLCNQVHQAIPGSIISIAAPAVDWNSTLDIPRLSRYIDYFIIMGYDYYWDGSSEAGPVDGLYPMTGGYSYAIACTISWYKAQGTPSQKMLLGLPYYGRDWPTAGSVAPAATTGSGTAYTYRTIRNNSSGNYSPANRHWEAKSYTPYYAYNNGNWRQCFVNSLYSLSKRYDLVNQHALAGIGIWALGYDDGYTELWDLIDNKFTTCATNVCHDTIFDSGGPAFNYYNNENYTTTINTGLSGPVNLIFNAFSLESGYDSVWIYEGTDTLAPMLGKFSGDVLPGMLSSSNGTFTLKFHSDGATSRSGWSAIWWSPWNGLEEPQKGATGYLSVYPNPCKGELYFHTSTILPKHAWIEVIDINGKCLLSQAITQNDSKLILPEFNPGIYLLKLQAGSKMNYCRFIVE